MLQLNPTQRPSCAELLHCEWLNDPYVRALHHLETLQTIEAS